MADAPISTLPTKSRGWLSFFGIFSLLVGFFAIAFPYVMTVAIEQVIGIVLIATGVFSIGGVLFGETTGHRVATTVLAIIRVVAGLAMLVYIAQGVLALTVVLAAFFFAEGITFLVSAFAMRSNKAWFLVLINGIVALVLGGMILSGFPGTAAWVIGLLYGINSIFYGVSLLGLAAGAGKSA
jgi:Uncharacterized conserved protein